MSQQLADFLTISPAIWPGAEPAVQPGDLSQFAPLGNGLGGPLVMMPWDTLDDVMNRPGYYSYRQPSAHPFRGAPTTDGAGGTIYLGRKPEREDFDVLLRLMDVYTHTNEYAAFVGNSFNPLEERFLVQLRLVNIHALNGHFSVPATIDNQPLAPQKLNLGDALWGFIEQQTEQWGTGYSYELEGCMGGDGDWAREKLSFGFMVENSYWGIYRIWSRAWLVTK